ncbi:alpha/beta fold hydrolase [Auraticoccus monumenti]|uniref:Pimeloyl-ACP methyl ester carboxylesterase n=1 Tax=Auraticoccus monumenti TaxID=675864 RepID=A0A1G6ZDS9_9ACTN|nr:alpha/beta hydrolase [Auraticoccus monumenti]SDE00045.1 Pimeloyl-ACP methyl ester carboxylesterase [Auraticoccus monumenti]
MATFALIHGGGSTSWDWHRVIPLLERAGHAAVAVDLPTEDATSTLDDYVQTVVDAVGDREHVIVVGHSLGGFTAPLACEALRAEGLVYLAAMIPVPGETFGEWWANTGHDRETIDDDPAVSFFNGVPESLAAEARSHERGQTGAWFSSPWPADHHPAVPTRGILGKDDQFFPAPFMRRQIRDRLGTEAVEVDGGHYLALSEPEAVATALIAFAEEVVGERGDP